MTDKISVPYVQATTVNNDRHMKPRQRRIIFTLTALALLFSFQYSLFSISFPSDTSQGEDSKQKPFEWSSITPTSTLEFYPCYDIFQCGRLEVPLDWNSTAEDGGTKATIAIIKKPARVNITDSRYGGPILMNPGGPGGSGTLFLQKYGSPLQEIVDTPAPADTGPAGERFFDILSWDPRGVGQSTPSHPGISDPGTNREFTQQLAAIGLSLEENEVFNKVWSLKRIYGATISSPEIGQTEDGELVGQFVSTANVVRDMVEIVERHGEWREKTARRLVANSSCDEGSARKLLERTAWRRDAEPLQYWGFSYGTVLGQTFASMQPDRVHRMVLDGVVDAEDYAAAGWSTNLWDIEKISQRFASACVDAGPDLCPIAAWSPGNAAGLLTSFLATLDQFKSDPVTNIIDNAPVFVSHSDVLSTIFSAWYNGYTGFKLVADLLWELSNDNASMIYAQRPPFTCQHPNPPGKDAHSDAASTGILCTDGPSLLNETKEDYMNYMSWLQQQSPTFAGFWATIRMPCHGYSTRAKWRFSDSFGAKTPVGILFASQSLDPVTPIRNAIGASKLFPGSQVLEVQGAGHCTLGFPSVCGAKKIRQYFRTGHLDEDMTVCPVSVEPFGTQEEEEARFNELSLEDRGLTKSVMDVGKMWPPKYE